MQKVTKIISSPQDATRGEIFQIEGIEQATFRIDLDGGFEQFQVVKAKELVYLIDFLFEFELEVMV